MSRQKKVKSAEKPWYRKWWGVAILILIAISAIGAATKNQTNEPSEPQIRTNYIQPEWKITNTEVVGSQYIVVTGYLRNQTDEQGAADCIVEFYDRENNWARGKGLSRYALEPGQTYEFTLQVEVEHTGLIAKQNVHCEQ